MSEAIEATTAQPEPRAHAARRDNWAAWGAWIAGALGAIILYALCQSLGLLTGLDRPATLMGFGLVGGAIFCIALVVLGVIASILTGGSDRAGGLFAAGVSLALFALGAGTMDNWLEITNFAPGRGDAQPYLVLMPEHLFLWGAMLVIALSAGFRHAPGVPATSVSTSPGAGVISLLIGVAVSGLSIQWLSGPFPGKTFHGQIYFAAIVGFVFGTVLARKYGGARDAIWYWSAPFVLGIAGLGSAALRPVLPGGYDMINILPASPLARPLPIELIGVGVAAVIWSLRWNAGLAEAIAAKPDSER